MTKTVLITGATGFVGKALLSHADSELQDLSVRLLVRDRRKLPPLDANISIIEGDLTDSESYFDALQNVDTVIHLAAMTGKASAKTHDRLNRQATKELIAASKTANVGHFVFISTIAAGYEDKAFYPYAVAKHGSEQDLRESRLAHTILRPTIVFGPGSPVWGSLSMLAGLSMVPLPSRGKAVEAQPIDVEDVCRAIIRVLKRGEPTNEILELGGPDKLTMRELLLRIGTHGTGKRSKVLPIPLRLIQWPLAMMEPVLRPLMPVTAGQFAVFGNPSPAAPNWLSAELAPQMIDLQDMMFRASESNEPSDDEGSAPKGPATTKESAEKEAVQLARHMSGNVPTERVLNHYQSALERLNLQHEGHRFDQFLLSWARQGGLALRLVDAYCGFFRRRGMLRRRQVLMAALLEHDAGAHQVFDDAFSKGPIRALFRLATTGVMSGLLTLAGVLTLSPARLFFAVRGD